MDHTTKVKRRQLLLGVYVSGKSIAPTHAAVQKAGEYGDDGAEHQELKELAVAGVQK